MILVRVRACVRVLWVFEKVSFTQFRLCRSHTQRASKQASKQHWSELKHLAHLLHFVSVACSALLCSVLSCVLYTYLLKRRKIQASTHSTQATANRLANCIPLRPINVLCVQIFVELRLTNKIENPFGVTICEYIHSHSMEEEIFLFRIQNAKKETSSSLVYKQQKHKHMNICTRCVLGNEFVLSPTQAMLRIYIFHFILFLFHICVCIKQFLMKMNICDRLVFMYIFVWSALTHFDFVSSSSFEWNYIKAFQFFRHFKFVGKFFFLVWFRVWALEEKVRGHTHASNAAVTQNKIMNMERYFWNGNVENVKRFEQINLCREIVEIGRRQSAGIRK